MPGATPTYGLPYQDLADPPDGPSLGEDLALAVEAQLARMDTSPTNQVFTASGSLTAAQVAGAKALRIRVWGATGAGGGAGATIAGQSSIGGGGAGASYGESIVAIASVTFPLAVTIGAAGVAVAGAAGGDGGTTTAGPITVAGSTGGGASAADVILGLVAVPGAPGALTGADVSMAGGYGGSGNRVAATYCMGARGGAGANGAGETREGNSTSTAGIAATLTAGGSGARNSGAQASRAGGNGTPGLVVIEPIY
jgi:hypothetical protein